MNAKDRDNLLIRLDERSINTWRILDEVKELQREMNGTVKSDHAWISALRWVTGLLALALIGAITTGLIGVW